MTKNLDKDYYMQSRSLTQGITYGIIVGTLFALVSPSVVYAVKVDLEALGKATFNPVVTFIDNWYGTGIFTAGVGGAAVAQGDLKTRAFGFGIGAIVSGLMLIGVKAGLGIAAAAQ